MKKRDAAVAYAEQVAQHLVSEHGATHDEVAGAFEAAADWGDQVVEALGAGSHVPAAWREVAHRHASVSRAATAAYRSGWETVFGAKPARA